MADDRHVIHQTEHFTAHFERGSDVVRLVRGGAGGTEIRINVRDYAEIAEIMNFYMNHEIAEAPQAVGWSFTFEQGRPGRRGGVRWRDDGRGCPVWYLSNADYERAHTEADDPPRAIDWAEGRIRTDGRRP